MMTTLRNLVDRLRRGRARRRAIQELRRSLALIVDLEALEASVATRLKELFDPDRLLILQLDRRAARFRPSFVSGLSRAEVAGVELPAEGRLARWFLVNESCLLLPRDRAVLSYLDARERITLEGLGVQLAAPLVAQNHLVGMLLLSGRRGGRPPSRGDAEILLQLANQASLAFQNAALYREQQERLDRLHRADRLAAVGQLAASVAHEVRNPLTSIRSTMQYLAGGFEEGDPRRELAAELIDEVDRIDSTISGLLSLTRSGELQPAAVELVSLLRQTVRLVETQARKQAVVIEERYDAPELVVMADGGQVKQVFLNLILNALQAMPDGGRVTVRLSAMTSPTSGEAPSWAVVEIADDGPGIPPDKLKSVFDPFFTTKSEGTGLGLAICHGIVERHGGEIELLSTEGEGTTAVIQLPRQGAGGRQGDEA